MNTAKTQELADEGKEQGDGKAERREGVPQKMQELMDNFHGFRSLRVGDIIEGTVMRVAQDAILVDIMAKSEGVIPSHEMQTLGPEGISRMKVGDKVLVYVVHGENKEGQITLSLDKAAGEKGWHTLEQLLESGDSFEAEVVGTNKGGLLVNALGVHGFVPLSQIVSGGPEVQGEASPEQRLAHLLGRKVTLKVIEMNRKRNRLILSERAALQEWRSQQKAKLLAELREGETRRGKVTGIRNFGIFVDIGGADGLVHRSELSWEQFSSPEEIVKVGDEVDVYVMKVDAETKRIALSLRRAQPGPWESFVAKHGIGQIVTGKITKVVAFGAFARIDGAIEGLIHISELADQRIGHPKEVVKEGDTVDLKIIRIEPEHHRLALSLRQARGGAEDRG
ncbi:MAG: S1 RNA-binding domain-containing protein [Chloroflexi bacterium]|nr:S1 RNA-binding domain-containing protein [Chloroflexota bacterium]